MQEGSRVCVGYEKGISRIGDEKEKGGGAQDLAWEGIHPNHVADGAPEKLPAGQHGLCRSDTRAYKGAMIAHDTRSQHGARHAGARAPAVRRGLAAVTEEDRLPRRVRQQHLQVSRHVFLQRQGARRRGCQQAARMLSSGA